MDPENFDCEEKSHESAHYWRSGKYIKSLVFGALDGLNTSLAFLGSTIAAGEIKIANVVVLCVGLSQLVGDAFSMGIGDYLSSLAEGDVLARGHAGDALRNGLVMFGSFIVFGFVPMIAYFPIFYSESPAYLRFWTACFLAVLCLFVLGCIKGRLERRSMARAGAIMVATGSIATFLAYWSGQLIHRFIDPEHQPGLIAT